MNRRDAITSAFEILKISEETFISTKISLSEFINILSNSDYNLVRDCGYSRAGLSKFLKRNFPNREVNNKKFCNYLFNNILNKNYCFSCERVLDLKEFYIKKKHNSYCKSCEYSKILPHMRGINAKRKATLINAIPPWANLEDIKRIYNECPAGMQVDHIFPLQANNSCGLHVSNNLQYLSKKDNLIKGNRNP